MFGPLYQAFLLSTLGTRLNKRISETLSFSNFFLSFAPILPEFWEILLPKVHFWSFFSSKIAENLSFWAKIPQFRRKNHWVSKFMSFWPLWVSLQMDKKKSLAGNHHGHGRFFRCCSTVSYVCFTGQRINQFERGRMFGRHGFFTPSAGHALQPYGKIARWNRFPPPSKGELLMNMRSCTGQ